MPITPRDADTADAMFQEIYSEPAVCEHLVSLRERVFVLPLCQIKTALIKSAVFIWRRGRDSNPRVLLAQTDFESAPL